MEKPDLAPLAMPERFRTEVSYFITPSGEHGIPKLPTGQYWVRLEDARRWLDDGGVEVISPLAPDAKAEFELTEEQETWLEWMIEHQLQHIRVG